jgi:SAM-dependent methyltransferase
MGKLNLYGDQLVATTGSHGPDIASQRLDDLDKRALDAVLRSDERPTCIDLGCGFGWQGLRFALLGAPSYLFDLQQEPAALARFRIETQLPMTFWSGDIHALPDADLPTKVDIGFSQRFIHFLRFEQARILLSRIAARMQPGARFFISGSGIASELGDGYAGKESPLHARFDHLQAEMAQKHNILEPVCLYDQDDLSLLMLQAGFERVEIWRSAFGNIKGVFRRS